MREGLVEGKVAPRSGQSILPRKDPLCVLDQRLLKSTRRARSAARRRVRPKRCAPSAVPSFPPVRLCPACLAPLEHPEHLAHREFPEPLAPRKLLAHPVPPALRVLQVCPRLPAANRLLVDSSRLISLPAPSSSCAAAFSLSRPLARLLSRVIALDCQRFFALVEDVRYNGHLTRPRRKIRCATRALIAIGAVAKYSWEPAYTAGM